MVCPRCSAENDSTMQFCYNCGMNLQSAAPVPAVPAPSTPAYGTPAQPPTPYGTPASPTPPAYGTPAQPPSPYNPPAQPSPYGMQAPQQSYPATLPNSTAAIVSLIAGIVSWVAIPFIAAIVAIVAGRMGRAEIRRSGGTLGGEGMALAGLIMGYAQIALLVVVVCGVLAFLVLAGASASP